MDPNSYLNQIKLFYLVMKVGGDVFVETLAKLYSGDKPIEENLLKVAEIKSNCFNFDDKTFLTNLKEGENDIKNMDISLCFKLIQLTCGLEPKQCSLNNFCVWSKRCPKEKQEGLEHLLYKYKLKRNDLVHQFSNLGLISDEEFTKRKEENFEHLSAIVGNVGDKAKLSSDEIKSWMDKIELDSHAFCKQVGIIDPSPATGKMAGSRIRPHSILPIPVVNRMVRPMHPNIKGILLKACAESDVDLNRAKPLEKSNRLYWVDRLVSSQALHDSEQNSTFWKDYEEYSN